MARADKLIEQAKEHFGAGESPLAAVSGVYETKVGKRDTLRNGVLIATNQRLLFYAKKLTGFDLEAFPYQGISSLEMGKKLGGRWIKFFASGNTVSMKWIQDDMTAFVDVVQSKMAGAGHGIDRSVDDAPPTVQPNEPDSEYRIDGTGAEGRTGRRANSGSSGSKGLRGCLRLVAIGFGVILGVTIVLSVLVAIFGPDGAEKEMDDGGDVPVASPDGVLLGRWRLEFANGELVGIMSLVHRGGVMYADWQYGSDKTFPEVVVERPSGLSDVRKFDPNPEETHGEYFTVSASGVLRRLAWEGREILSAEAEQWHPDAMSIGFNPVERACTATELSALALEIIGLYEELHSFKATDAFATFGFSQNGPYYAWLEAVRRAIGNREGGLEVYRQLGFVPGDLVSLGLSHMRVATSVGRNRPASESDRRSVHDLERKVQAGIALAECRD